MKGEELFIVYKRVAELLRERGVIAVDPQVGEFRTSFDMAGASLTLLWLDEELERLWLAPADTPAHRTSTTDLRDSAQDRDESVEVASTVPAATAASQAAAAWIADALAAVSAAVHARAIRQEEAGADAPLAVAAAAAATERAAQATSALVPRIGPARSHGARSLGTPDPGAVSFALIMTTLGDKTRRGRTDGGGRAMNKLRVVIGSDDAGFGYKMQIRADLEHDDRIAEVHDVGVDAQGRTAYR